MSAPLLEDIIESGVDSALDNVYTTQPGVVTAFDPTTHTVSVQPLIQKWVTQEDGSTKAVNQPVITDVPLMFLGAGGNRTTFPVPPGSPVVLHHTSGALDAWQHSDGTKTADPGDSRKHSITDAFAVPATLTNIAAKAAASGSGRIDETGTIIHTDGKLYLGGGPTEPVARVSDVKTALTELLTDSSVISLLAAYQAAIASTIGVPVAKAALEAGIAAHFVAHPVEGSSVTETE